jgi:hypothetical protein
MTKLSAQQDLKLNLVSSADQRWRDAKKTLEVDVRREIKERSRFLLDARNEAVLIAYESGIPKTQIALRGLHTQRTAGVAEALVHARTRKAALVSHRFSRGDSENEFTITLTGTTLNDACRDHSWSVSDAIDASVDSATFRVADPLQNGEVVLAAVTSSFLPGFEKPHPVVAWGRAHADEALAWWKEAAAWE